MAELFNITHDAGNLDEYDATVTDGGDLSTGTPGLASTTAKMEALIDDQTAIYGTMNLDSETRFRVRFYLDPNSISASDSKVLLLVAGYISGPTIKYHVQLYTDSPNDGILLNMRDDGGTWHATASYAITDAEHYIEVDWMAATGVGQNDGFASLWIDGALKETLSNLDTDTFSLTEVRFGAAYVGSASFAGTIYLDEIKANDDGSEIGPVAAVADFPPAPSVRWPRRSPILRM